MLPADVSTFERFLLPALSSFEGWREGERLGEEGWEQGWIDGGEMVLNSRRPTAGCFSLPGCINLFGLFAAVPVQGASQHLELK